MGTLSKAQQDAIIEQTNEMLDKSKNINSLWNEIYADGINYLFDNQLNDKYRGEGWEYIATNKIFPGIMQEVSQQFSRRISIVAQPWEPQDTEGADIWSELLQWEYEKGTNFDTAIRIGAIMDSKISGIYGVKLFWDDQAEWDDTKKQWKGRLKMVLIAPNLIGIDPDAGTNPRDAQYYFIRQDVPLEKAKALYPKHAKDLEKQAAHRAKYQDTDKAGMRYTSRMLGALTMDDAKDPGINAQNDGMRRVVNILAQRLDENNQDRYSPEYVTITEFYYRDYTIKKTTIPGEKLRFNQYPEGSIDVTGAIPVVVDPKPFRAAGLKVKKGQPLTRDIHLSAEDQIVEEPAYPYGRMILRADDIILNPNTEDQRYGYTRWPLVLGKNLPLPHNPRGLNSVELARPNQDLCNIIFSATASHAKLAGGPILEIEEGALPDDPENRDISELLEKNPGAFWKLADGARGQNKLGYQQPPQLDSSIFSIYQEAERGLQDIIASPDISIGRSSPGEMSATESTLLAENAAIRQDLPSKLMDYWFAEVWELAAEILKKNLSVEDIVRVIGDGENTDRVTQLVQSDFDARFDLKIEVTDTLPFSKQAKKQDAIALFEMFGQMSPTVAQQLLEAFEVPERSKIMEEITAFQQSQAQAAQQQAQTEANESETELELKDRELDIEEKEVNAKIASFQKENQDNERDE